MKERERYGPVNMGDFQIRSERAVFFCRGVTVLLNRDTAEHALHLCFYGLLHGKQVNFPCFLKQESLAGHPKLLTAVRGSVPRGNGREELDKAAPDHVPFGNPASERGADKSLRSVVLLRDSSPSHPAPLPLQKENP